MAHSQIDASVDATASETIIISSSGDLVLEAFDEKLQHPFSYRVDVSQLRQSSAYFDRLLDPSKFGEGNNVAAQLQRLRLLDGVNPNISIADLPRVRVENIGRTSKVNSIKLLFGDFLKILHNQDVVASQSSPGNATMPVANLANLAVVADRFDAIAHLSAYIHRKRILEGIDGRTKGKVLKQSEERLRQRLLIGLLFEYSAWALSASQQLIIVGSVRWKSDAAPDDTDSPLWWDLPLGIEEELITRRDYILDTIQSLALHFVNLYSSGVQQCRMGYSTSWVCDSFHLGEMIKFFKKHNVVKIGPVLTGQDEFESHSGDIERIFEILKSSPPQRMDEHHPYCGLRTRLQPLIESLEPYLRFTSPVGVGICIYRWKQHRAKYAWSQAKRPVSWRAPVPKPPARLGLDKSLDSEASLNAVNRSRDMFMAVDRDWTPKEESNPGLKFGMSTPFLKND